MPIFRVVGSCNGLLCLSGVYDHEAVYIYNPFTRQHKMLPNCNEFEVNEVVYGFGIQPATNEYKVIKVGYYPHVYYATWSPGNINSHDLPRSEVHLFSLDRLIVAFDLSNDTFQEVPRPDFNVNLFHCRCHLAALRGCLCACLLTSNSENYEIWIMEEYNKKESWVKQFNIGASSIVNQDLLQSYDIWRTSLQKGNVTVMCLLKNGNILLDCQGGILISYSTDKKMLKSISLCGMPKSCQAIGHVGSLNWLANPI
ncbi:hypothetical protein RND71_013110 [Anisodus tanguticus]|uniref:F-box associated domain-containing protein n=1 Tax=Anisodus tanguticus TaxID=243964 RepID=A0AAE1SH81_9SOLA|nr:hypothetical protein RND71_013110 [Anisodus tanguticus]